MTPSFCFDGSEILLFTAAAAACGAACAGFRPAFPIMHKYKRFFSGAKHKTAQSLSR